MTSRMTLSELRAQQEKAQDKRRVRGTVRTKIGNESFDSKREARRWQELRLLERAGEIRDLKRQVPFELMGQNAPIKTPTGLTMQYRADFVYFDCRIGAEVVEDAKGWCTEVARLKHAILAAQGIEVVLT
jgi:hypothetical protein